MQSTFLTDEKVDRPSLSPRLRLDELSCRSGRIHVVRDDLLPGGTKQRACLPYLENEARRGFQRFLYASPFAGFAQVALAYASQRLGLRCELFCEQDRSRPSLFPRKHDFTRLAESYGARVHLFSSLGEADEAARFAAGENPASLLIPLGFNSPDFRENLKRELRKLWRDLLLDLGAPPKRLWLPVGSGTLLSVFRGIVPEETEIHAVNVRVLPLEDSRLRGIASDPRVNFYSSPEAFHEVADLPPEIPSNLHYDAKLWRFLEENGRDGDLWWNVAR